MEPVSRKFLGYALALSIAGTAFAGDEPKKSEDALETARRDLQTLPTVEGNILPGERLPDASIPVPTFSPITTNSGRGGADENRTPAPSEGWLLDALRKTDDVNAQRNDRDPNKLRTTDTTTSRRNDTPAVNPLRTYLDLWLSPQDKKLLNTGKPAPGQRTLDRNGLRSEEPFRAKSEFELRPALGDNQQRSLGLNTPRLNPYLSNPDADVTAGPEPLAPLPTTTRKSSTPSTTSLLPSSGSLYPAAHDSAPTLETRKSEEPLPVPTAPLIDDRRYFPQLRRF